VQGNTNFSPPLDIGPSLAQTRINPRVFSLHHHPGKRHATFTHWFRTPSGPNTDTRRRELTFEVGDYVYLKVSPIRSVKRFNMKGKLAPRYIGPFKIVERRGEVAYQLELPESLAGVHDVFHVSQLKKYLRVPEEQIPLEELTVKKDLTYEEFPVKILETAKKVTRSRTIKMCKVQWNRYTESEATWEREEDLRKTYLQLFE
jgi:hypothetical protein